MEKLSYARSFRDLFAYQQDRALAKDIFEVSKRFPREDKADLFCSELSTTLREPAAEYFVEGNPDDHL